MDVLLWSCPLDITGLDIRGLFIMTECCKPTSLSSVLQASIPGKFTVEELADAKPLTTKKPPSDEDDVALQILSGPLKRQKEELPEEPLSEVSEAEAPEIEHVNPSCSDLLELFKGENCLEEKCHGNHFFIANGVLQEKETSYHAWHIFPAVNYTDVATRFQLVFQKAVSAQKTLIKSY